MLLDASVRRGISCSFCGAVVVCVADVATMEEVEFKWQGFATEVLVTGDFMNWDQKLTLSKTGDDVFTAKLVSRLL